MAFLFIRVFGGKIIDLIAYLRKQKLLDNPRVNYKLMASLKH